MTRLIVGWERKGKPFTREQFKKSYIRKSFGGSNFSYKQYLRDIAELRRKRLRMVLKPSKR